METVSPQLLRFGSVHYTATVWVNGQPLVTHSGGHLPFEAEVPGDMSQTGLIFLLQVGHLLHYSEENMVTVAVNNTLNRSGPGYSQAVPVVPVHLFILSILSTKSICST